MKAKNSMKKDPIYEAAPELYEALKAVESWMDDLSDDYEFKNPFFLNLLENARAALAKAEGGQP